VAIAILSDKAKLQLAQQEALAHYRAVFG